VFRPCTIARYQDSDPVLRPSDNELKRAAEILNGRARSPSLARGLRGAHAGAYCSGREVEGADRSPLRGKEFIEYDNPHDVGMTGLLGFSSGYHP